MESPHVLVEEGMETFLQQEQTSSRFQPVLIVPVVETERQLLEDHHCSKTWERTRSKFRQSPHLAPPSPRDARDSHEMAPLSLETRGCGWDSGGGGPTNGDKKPSLT